MDTDEPEDEIRIPPPITHHTVLASVGNILLFSLQIEATANITPLQEDLKREKRRIETLEVRRRARHTQRKITGSIAPRQPPLSTHQQLSAAPNSRPQPLSPLLHLSSIPP